MVLTRLFATSMLLVIMMLEMDVLLMWMLVAMFGPVFTTMAPCLTTAGIIFAEIHPGRVYHVLVLAGQSTLPLG